MMRHQEKRILKNQPAERARTVRSEQADRRAAGVCVTEGGRQGNSARRRCREPRHAHAPGLGRAAVGRVRARGGKASGKRGRPLDGARSRALARAGGEPLRDRGQGDDRALGGAEQCRVAGELANSSAA